MKKTKMNKGLLALLAFVAILFTGFTLSACSNEEDNPEEKKTEEKAHPIVGIWKMDEKLSEGGGGNAEVTPAPTLVYEVYNTDGSYHKTDAPNSKGQKSEEGTYTVKDDELVVEYAGADGNRVKQTFKFEIKEDKLTKTDTKSGEIAKYTKFKVNP